MTKTFRAFYGHSANEPTDVVDKTCKELRNLLLKKFTTAGKGTKVSVIPGRDDFRINCRGDWNAWGKSIVARRDAMTQQPYYDFIIIPGSVVGRATAQIVEWAVQVGRPVFMMVDTKGVCGPTYLVRVTQVYPYDPDDWQQGFRCETAEQQAQKVEEVKEAEEDLQLPLPLIYKERPSE